MTFIRQYTKLEAPLSLVATQMGITNLATVTEWSFDGGNILARVADQIDNPKPSVTRIKETYIAQPIGPLLVPLAIPPEKRSGLVVTFTANTITVILPGEKNA